MSAQRQGAHFGKHAVVVGASMAGMVAARVLADHFESVTILERDQLAESPEARKGVPQGYQPHAVLARGTEVLARLFPGFWEEMVADGAVPIDAGTELIWYHHGAWKVRVPGPIAYGQSRPFLDFHVRQRLLKDCARVSIRRADVAGLIHDAAQKRVTGVRLRGEGGQETPLEADLVVDASGRGTRTPRWLEELGYGRPPEEQVQINIAYASRVVEPPPGKRDWKGMLVYGKPPHERRLGFILPIEGGKWSLTLAGYHGDHPPTDEAGFMDFARSVHHPDYFAVARETRPLSPIYQHKVPSDQRYYYERMKSFPDGLAVLGDAICSFNPIFAQGVTTSILGAETLGECLAERSAGQWKGLSADFQKRTTRFNDNAWALATSDDMRYPETQGQRPPVLKALHWYTKQVMELCSVDPDVMKHLIKINHMQVGLDAIMSPAIAFKAFRWGLGLRGNRALVVAHPPEPLRAVQ